MKIIEKNVITGKVTERNYTQKELNAIDAMNIADIDRRKQKDVSKKREEAIEDMLMTADSIKAKAYQQAVNG